ncbi:lytic transglycosylase domain-containing protein [Roseovarius sp. SYSU LYC5161]|uniref:lytic transglycosylase domain-containing protein n=1 Tax=Roseovarius halophilus (ex Wu et al. 2025) TaxID=3376060 RepID=UPI0039994EFE
MALMLPLVPEVARERAEIRQRIEDGRGEVDDLLRALPPDARSAPGIAHAVFNRHIAEGESDRAIEVILRQSRIAGGLGRAERWSGWRRALARAEMRRGNAETAYELAAFHQLSAGARFADLEWLAGYVALRYLDAPGLALDHFQRLRSAVQTPISLGRAGYWMGRALDAAGDPAAARDAYLLGAEHPTSFYGILAAEEGGVSLDGIPSGPQRGVDWRVAAFTDSDLYKVGVLALSMGRLTLAERFFVRLSETLGPDDLALMGAMLEELEQPHLQVMVGKAAARRGLVVPAPYYALHPLTEGNLPVPEELVLAIARRESEFDPGVVSGAGAEGLMQLMPGTAREVAVGMGLDHAPGRVLSDWRYNADLGAGYLAGLAERFGGNIVMISAGYNAGPARPPRWMELYGDPRGRGVDVIDWIEHIPFRETRNYVMRVAESLPVYRARLGRTPLPVPFSEELAGATIRVRGQ